MVLKEHYEADNLAMMNMLKAQFRQITCCNPHVRVPPPILNDQSRPDTELSAKVYNAALSSPG